MRRQASNAGACLADLLSRLGERLLALADEGVAAAEAAEEAGEVGAEPRLAALRRDQHAPRSINPLPVAQLWPIIGNMSSPARQQTGQAPTCLAGNQGAWLSASGRAATQVLPPLKPAAMDEAQRLAGAIAGCLAGLPGGLRADYRDALPATLGDLFGWLHVYRWAMLLQSRWVLCAAALGWHGWYPAGA
jgi:hypothetical protein